MLVAFLDRQPNGANGAVAAVTPAGAPVGQPAPVARQAPTPICHPESLKGLTMPTVMIDFYLKGWYVKYMDGYKGTRGNKSVRKTIRACVELASLFLSNHIPQLPVSAPNTMASEASAWRVQVKELCTEAWANSVAFLKSMGVKPSTSCSTFEKSMKGLVEHWPAGLDHNHSRNDVLQCFRSPTTLKAEVRKNRTRSRKRKDPPNDDTTHDTTHT